MKDVELHRWWMPPNAWSKKPYLSRYAMTDEEAKRAGALRPEPSTREVRRGDGGTFAGLAHLGSAPSSGHH